MRIPWFLVALGLAGNAAAQPHLFPLTIGGGHPLQNQHYFAGQFLLDRTSGRLTTLVNTGAAPRPLGMKSLAYGARNATIVFGTGDTSGPGYAFTNGFFRYDLGTKAYTTIYTERYMAVQSLLPDSNNDLLAVVNFGTPTRIYRVQLSGAVATITPSGNWRFTLPVFANVESGDLLVEGYSADRKRFEVLAFPNQGAVRTLYANPSGFSIVSRASQSLADGSFYFADQRWVFRWSGGNSQPSSVAALPIVPPETAAAFVLGHQSAAVSRAYVVTTATSFFPISLYVQRLHHLDPRLNFLVTKTVDVVRASNKPTRQPYPWDGIYNHRSRYISSVRIAAGKWRLNYNFPLFGGKSYRVVAGASGVRPATPLADGRIIWLNLDGLAVATLQNALPGVWDPGPLQLDAAGHAAGGIDLSSIPGPLRVTIHVVAAVLDPSAPAGVAFVTEPHPIQL